MAFQNLRNNHQIYILYKDAVPTLEIGKVTNVTAPIPKYGNPSMYNDLVLDITADINGKSTNFQKLPANNDIADFGNNVVIAVSKDAMNNEVSSMKQRSLDILNSIEQHQSIIQGCDKILQLTISTPAIPVRKKKRRSMRCRLAKAVRRGKRGKR